MNLEEAYNEAFKMIRARKVNDKFIAVSGLVSNGSDSGRAWYAAGDSAEQATRDIKAVFTLAALENDLKLYNITINNNMMVTRVPIPSEESSEDVKLNEQS
jgi:hypothetical protein